MAVKIGITGHRKLEDKEDVRNRLRQAIEEILKHEQAFEAYSCLASGSDSIFAEVINRNGRHIKSGTSISCGRISE